MVKNIEHWKDYVVGFIEINENGDEYLIDIHKDNIDKSLKT